MCGAGDDIDTCGLIVFDIKLDLMNEDLGLPFGKMKKTVIMFDVDGTLISNEKDPYHANEEIRSMLITLSRFKNIQVGVWSGGGELHALNCVSQLGLKNYVPRKMIMAKTSDFKPDIAIDDIQDTALGIMNLIVKQK